MLETVINIAKRIWDWVDDRPINFVIFAIVCFAIPYFWKWLLIYLVMPGSFALTYAIYKYIQKARSK